MSNIINYTTVPRDGLIGEWLLDGDSGTGTATDVTWLNNDDNIGYNGKVGKFNGSSSKIDLPDLVYNPTSNDDFTISTWLNYNNTTRGTIAGKYHTSNTAGYMQIEFEINQTSNKITYGLGEASVSDTVLNSTETLTSGNWYCITYTYTASTKKMELFINGISDSSHIHSYGSLSAPGLSWSLGVRKRQPGVIYDVYLNGQLGLTRLYNKALTNSEIQSLYQEGLRKLGPTSTNSYPDLLKGMVGHWDFRDGNLSNLVTGENATNNGATLTTDHLGNANSGYSFDGVDDYIETAIKQGLNYTFWGWIKFTDSPGRRILQNHKLGFTTKDDGKIQFDDFVDDILTTNSSYDDGNWHFFAIQCNNGVSGGSYINIDGGAEIITGTINTDVSTENIRIGARNNDSEYYNGELSLLGFKNSLLSSSEISQLYNLTKENYIYDTPKYSLPNLQDGLVLDIDGTHNGDTYYDQSGNGNHGTQSGGVGGGKIGQHKYMSFDGSDDYIDTIDFDISNIHSYSANFYIADGTDLSDGKNYVIIGCNDAPREMLEVRDGRLQYQYRVNSNGDNLYIDSGIELETGKYYNASIVYNGDKTDLYFNGIFVGTADLTFDSAIKNIGIGISINNNGDVGQYWNGNISNIKIYNRALSPQEVQQLYYATKITE